MLRCDRFEKRSRVAQLPGANDAAPSLRLRQDALCRSHHERGGDGVKVLPTHDRPSLNLASTDDGFDQEGLGGAAARIDGFRQPIGIA